VILSNHCKDGTALSGHCQGVSVDDVLSVFGGSSLLLDSIQNNSHFVENSSPAAAEFCPTPTNIYAEFISHTDKGDVYRKTRVPCKKWACPVCGKRNAAKLKKRLKQAVRALAPTLQADRDKARYSLKLLTLTVPGNSYRLNHSPVDAEKEMKSCFDRLIKATRKYFGAFEYVWVKEDCKGWPHLHVLLVGNNIASIELLGYIRSLWCHKYGMGFVKLNCIGEPERAIHYVTKYITKGLETGSKGSRVFSMSKEFNKLSQLQKLPVTVLKVYEKLDYDDGTFDIRILYEPSFDNPVLLLYEKMISDEMQAEIAYREEQLTLWRSP